MLRTLMVLVVAVVGAGWTQATEVEAASSITAAAKCEGAEVRIQVTNRTGATVHVTYASALVDAADLLADELDIPSGASQAFRFTSTTGAIAGQGGLVVTSAGVLLPSCAGERITLRPEGEGSAITMGSIAVLESLRAYEALYALLHPDAKALLSPQQMTCWYADFLGDATTAEPAILDVAYAPWTWGANGRTYDAAGVHYRQTYWSNGGARDQEDVEHLVLDRGQWRWFLGEDAAWLAGLPGACAATGGSPSGDASGTEYGTEPCADADRWWTETYYRVADGAAILGGYDRLAQTTTGKSYEAAATAQGYADAFARLAGEQRASDPPPAAGELNGYFVDLFGWYQKAMEGAVVLLSPDYHSPFAMKAAASQVRGSFNEAADLTVSELGVSKNEFLALCNPTVGAPEESVGP
jgi:hypothetical protein